MTGPNAASGPTPDQRLSEPYADSLSEDLRSAVPASGTAKELQAPIDLTDHLSATGPKSAFVSGLYAQQSTPLVKYLTARFRNSEEAKEIAQEAWLRFYRLPAPEELQNAKAFLFQTASNLAIDRARRANLEQRYLDQEAKEPQREETPSIEQDLQGREELALIEQALNELPVKCRQAFMMHRLSGLSYPGIAESLSVSTSMVEKYIIQALKHFRNTLNRN